MPLDIIFVEDDQKLASLLMDYFQGFGFSVAVISSGKLAVTQIIEQPPAMVVLDLMLPQLDGLSVCRAIRDKYAGKILMLTASGDDMDQVAALEMGADDFVQKPIQPRVLLARIRMLLRRTAPSSTTQVQPTAPGSDKIITLGQLWIHKTLQCCKLADHVVALTPSEFSLLWHLASHSDTVFSREDLLKSLNGLDYDGLDRRIDNKIAQLRKKLGDNANRPQGIITVRGKGYMLVPDFW